MIALVQNELMKTFSRKSSWIYFIGLFVIVLGGAIIYNILIDKVPEVFGDSSSTWLFMNTVVYGIGSLVTLFSVIIASANVAAEFGSGTIKQLLIRPHSRWKILLSKYISVLLYSLMMIVFLYVIGYIIGLIFFGAGNFNEMIQEYTLESTIEVSVGKQVVKKFLLFLPSLLIITTLSFMLSTLFKSQALAVGIGVFLLFSSSTIGGIVIMIMEKFTWTKYLIFPHLDLSIYAIEDTLASGVDLLFSCLLLLGYYVVIMAVTFIFFQKRDISF